VKRRRFLRSALGASALAAKTFSPIALAQKMEARDYRFDGGIPRAVLDNYLSRAISMEGCLHGKGDLVDDIRMLDSIGAKYIGRSICLWGAEGDLEENLERARAAIALVRSADGEIVFEACIFEIVTSQVNQLPVPEWAFLALGRPVEKRNFRYADIVYAEGPRKSQWGPSAGVPDVSRAETKLWFYFLAVTYIDMGIEGLHFGQAEIMNGNDPHLDHWAEVLTVVRRYASQHARRHWVVCNAHVPSGGLLRDGHLLLDFHAFPLRVKEVPGKPAEGVLEVGYLDSFYGRSKGGIAPSGWSCKHLPYLVELDNWGVSKQPGQAGAGGFWVWGYDEITWFAHQSQLYRSQWLQYAWNWVRQTDPNGYLEMPGGRTMRSPLDHRPWYYANRPSSAVPDGLNDEQAIRAIWAADQS
jgi:hypothetical protein